MQRTTNIGGINLKLISAEILATDNSGNDAQPAININLIDGENDEGIIYQVQMFLYVPNNLSALNEINGLSIDEGIFLRYNGLVQTLTGITTNRENHETYCRNFEVIYKSGSSNKGSNLYKVVFQYKFLTQSNNFVNAGAIRIEQTDQGVFEPKTKKGTVTTIESTR